MGNLRLMGFGWLAFALYLIVTKDENVAMMHVGIICGVVCSAGYEVVQAIVKGHP